MGRNEFAGLALALCGVLAIAVVLGVRDESPAGNSEHALGPPPSATTVPEDPGTLVSQRSGSPEVAPVAQAFDAQALIESHFGERADEARALLGQHGYDIDSLPAPFPEDQLRAGMPGWFTMSPSNRKAELDALLAWPKDGSDPAFLRERFMLAIDLSAEDCAAIDALVSAYLPDVSFHANRYLDQLEASLQRAARVGAYRLSPYVSLPQELEHGSDHFVSTTKVGSGWVVELALSRQDCPEVVDAKAELNAVLAARDADVRTSLEMLGG